jgi:hypothetical protein
MAQTIELDLPAHFSEAELVRIATDHGFPESIEAYTASILQSNLMASTFYYAIKSEFQIFLCTDHKRYAELRNKIANSSDVTQLALVSAIAAALGSHIGFTAGPIVAL